MIKPREGAGSKPSTITGHSFLRRFHPEGEMKKRLPLAAGVIHL
jgi:hypothetical protein